MDTSAPGHGDFRRLKIQWDATLIVLSWIVSFLGTYAASQVCCQSSLCVKGSKAYHGWNILAAVLFGLCAVWSLHFIAILGSVFPVKVSLSPGITVFSAVVAVFFTYLALISDTFTTKYLRRRWRRARRRAANTKKQAQLQAAAEGNNAGAPNSQDIPGTPEGGQYDLEEQPLLGQNGTHLQSESGAMESEGSQTNYKQTLMEDSRLRAIVLDDDRLERMSRDSQDGFGDTGLAPHPVSSTPISRSPSPGRSSAQHDLTFTDSSEASPTTPSQDASRRPSLSVFSRKWSSGNNTAKLSATASSADLTDSSDLGKGPSPSRQNSTDASTAASSSGSSSFVRGLPLSKREKRRLRSGSAMTTSLNELLWTLWGDCNAEAIAKAGIWATAIVVMHYSGMAALHIDGGYVVWNRLLVAASALIAWVVCLVGLLFMPNMEVNIGRQLAFSFIAASGVFAMHHTGMLAATWYSSAPPVEHPGYPQALVFFIVAFVILTCLISTTMVSHAATLSRNKLLEMVAVKQQLWRTLAQKEAVEATVALQTEFTSVAAHELRTPLYTITGYVDLLSRTAMDEEQALYVETVRRACHTIQLITTNVLDFTRLERANDEAQARPVLVELRSFIFNLAEITEDRGPRMDSSDGGLELLVNIADDVPEAVFLDETYLTRVLMNLINNAVKFCTKGYICVAADLQGADVKLTVTDTGIGIPKRFRERIFEPFRQADTSLTRLNNGSGLGLAICKRLVARLDGDIYVTSAEGEGSTFHVLLKKVQTSGTYQANGDDAQQKSMMVFTSSPRVQQAIGDAWARRGYKILRSEAEPALLQQADFIWTDLPTMVKKQPALLALVKAAPTDRSEKYPYILLAYSAEAELLAIPASPFVVPVRTIVPVQGVRSSEVTYQLLQIKRPLAINQIAELLRLPKEELPTSAGKEKPKLVRFASMQSSAPSEDSEDSPARGPLSPPPSSASEAMPLASTDKKTVLLVEDNPINAKLGERMLTTLGYTVLVAYNGLEALETAKMAHDSLFCVLMDLQMPVMSGEESTTLIRKHEADNGLSRLTILALSANVNVRISDSIQAVGADGFLSKPISMKSLGEALTRYTAP